MTTVSEAVGSRISTRAFTDQPVDRDTVQTILEKAQRAPSGGNVQPWRTIVATGPALQDIMNLTGAVFGRNPVDPDDPYPVYPPNLWEPYRSRRFAVGEALYATLGIPREDKSARLQWFANNYRCFGAPVALFFVIDTRMGHGQWGHMGMYAQTIALLAEEAGLGSCFQECWALLRPELKEHFKLAETEMIWCGMALGHPDRDAPVNTLRTERAELSEVVEWHGFD